jgi:catechol 2,3-dioxygenase-like lactoylglutathione lyase family enzyme
MEYRLELIILPVTDVDRARDFYRSIDFVVDHDRTVRAGLRFVQVTPPGSACSIAFGEGLTDAAPGSVKGLQVVVDSAQEAHEHLSAAGVKVTDVEKLSWGNFVHFEDPDGNHWSVQELPDYARHS